MKITIKKWQMIAVCSIALLNVACEKEENKKSATDNTVKVNVTEVGKYLIETTVKNPDGMSGASYMQLIPQLSGSYDNKNAIQIGFATTADVWDNHVFTFPSFNGGTQEIQKYDYTPQGLKLSGNMTIPPNAFPNSVIKVNDEKYYIPYYNLGEVGVFNPQSMKEIGRIDLKQYAHADASPDPAAGIIRDGILYLGLDQINAQWMPYQDYLQTDVALIDTQTDKVIKIISEKTSGITFPSRPHLHGMVFMNEQKDIYFACCGYFGYNDNYIISGFLCIPNGQKDFDTSRSWDISKTEILGTKHQNVEGKEENYKPSSIMNTCYIGNNKVAGFVTINELKTDNPYTARNAMAVIFDLKAKTIQKVNGVPLTDGHSVDIQNVDNNIIFGAYGEKEAGFYLYDMSQNSAKRIITTQGNPVYIHAFK